MSVIDLNSATGNITNHPEFESIREDFPILNRTIGSKPLVYLDNAATSQKPLQVIETLEEYYSDYNANIHRGVHTLSQEATDAYEEARKDIAGFLNAYSDKEVNFVRGTTEAINLVANAYGNKFVQSKHNIIISALEHHSNIVPWQMLCERTGAELRVIPQENGEWLLDKGLEMIDENTSLIAVNHTSNALGTINPIASIIEKAHSYNAKVLIDGAQHAPHGDVDVQALNCDFYCFSGHKTCGPTGIGVLWGKTEILESMDPYMGGGEMIQSVSFEKTTYNTIPFKFEAGTPNIAGAIGLASSLNYLTSLPEGFIHQQEELLLAYATSELLKIEGLHIYGPTDLQKKVAVISFNIEELHPYDIGVILDKLGIAVRTGHHCTQPIMEQFGISGTCRASFAFYNSVEEVNALVAGVRKAKTMLS